MLGDYYGEDYLRGYPITYINGRWVYKDNNKSIKEEWMKRPCGYCGKPNTKEGHDGCLGTLPKVMNACCGHGKKREAYIQFLNTKSIYGFKAFVLQKILKLFQKK